MAVSTFPFLIPMNSHSGRKTNGYGHRRYQRFLNGLNFLRNYHVIPSPLELLTGSFSRFAWPNITTFERKGNKKGPLKCFFFLLRRVWRGKTNKCPVWVTGPHYIYIQSDMKCMLGGTFHTTWLDHSSLSSIWYLTGNQPDNEAIIYMHKKTRLCFDRKYTTFQQ